MLGIDNIINNIIENIDSFPTATSRLISTPTLLNVLAEPVKILEKCGGKHK